MPRTEGAKNKQKTVAELLKMLKTAAETEGLELTPELINQTVALAKNEAANAGGTPEEIEAAGKQAAAKLEKFANLNIQLEENEEVDTFKCGVCGDVMATALALCPKCGAKLNW